MNYVGPVNYLVEHCRIRNLQPVMREDGRSRSIQTPSPEKPGNWGDRHVSRWSRDPRKHGEKDGETCPGRPESATHVVAWGLFHPVMAQKVAYFGLLVFSEILGSILN